MTWVGSKDCGVLQLKPALQAAQEPCLPVRGLPPRFLHEVLCAAFPGQQSPGVAVWSAELICSWQLRAEAIPASP